MAKGPYHSRLDGGYGRSPFKSWVTWLLGSNSNYSAGDHSVHSNATDLPSHIKVDASSRGPSYLPGNGLTLIRPGDQGISGLVTRHINVPKPAWKHYMRCLKERADKPPRRSIFGLPVLNPMSTPVKTWMSFMLLVDLVYTAFIVPVNVAFCTARYGNSIDEGCTLVDFVGGVIYLLHLLFMFSCGIVMVRDKFKVTVLDGMDVALYYCTNLRFVLDLVAVVPFIYLCVILGLKLDTNSGLSWIHLFSLVRLLRLARMLSISRMVTVDTASGQFKKLPFIGSFLTVPFMYTCLLIYTLMVIVNLQSCVLVLQATLQYDQGGATFYDSVSFVNAWEEPPAYRWYFAVYWVITTATGTGFGDVSPKNIAEQVIANVNMILGVLMFGLLVGTVSNALTRASATAHKLYTHSKRVAAVDEWLHKRDLPEALAKEVEAYFLQYGDDGGGTCSAPEQGILADLPAHLKDCALTSITAPLLSRVHAFDRTTPQLKTLLAGCFRAVTFLPGHDICVQGQDADRLWIVERGEVIVLQYEEQPLTMTSLTREQLSRISRIHSVSQPAASLRIDDEDHVTDTRYSPIFVPLVTPCMIGESVILADDVPTCRQRLVTYRAVQPCFAWELRVSDLWPLMQMYPDIRVTMLKYIQRRLGRELVGDQSPANHYCELAVVIARQLEQGADQTERQMLAIELNRADIESGELTNMLATLAEACCVRPWRPNDLNSQSPDHNEQDTIPQAVKQVRQDVLQSFNSRNHRPSEDYARKGSFELQKLKGSRDVAGRSPTKGRGSLPGSSSAALDSDSLLLSKKSSPLSGSSPTNSTFVHYNSLWANGNAAGAVQPQQSQQKSYASALGLLPPALIPKDQAERQVSAPVPVLMPIPRVPSLSGLEQSIPHQSSSVPNFLSTDGSGFHSSSSIRGGSPPRMSTYSPSASPSKPSLSRLRAQGSLRETASDGGSFSHSSAGRVMSDVPLSPSHLASLDSAHSGHFVPLLNMESSGSGGSSSRRHQGGLGSLNLPVLSKTTSIRAGAPHFAVQNVVQEDDMEGRTDSEDGHTTARSLAEDTSNHRPGSPHFKRRSHSDGNLHLRDLSTTVCVDSWEDPVDMASSCSGPLQHANSDSDSFTNQTYLNSRQQQQQAPDPSQRYLAQDQNLGNGRTPVGHISLDIHGSDWNVDDAGRENTNASTTPQAQAQPRGMEAECRSGPSAAGASMTSRHSMGLPLPPLRVRFQEPHTTPTSTSTYNNEADNAGQVASQARPVVILPTDRSQSVVHKSASFSTCAVCGHGLCPTCGTVASHPGPHVRDRDIRNGSQLTSHSAPVDHQDDDTDDAGGTAGPPPPPSARRSRDDVRRAVARLTRDRMNGAARGDTPVSGNARSMGVRVGVPWSRQVQSRSRLDRTSARLGSTSMARYRSLGVVSIPLQPDGFNYGP